LTTVAHTLCDAANAAAAHPRADKTAYPRLVLLTTILASSLASIDGSVVNVGLPAIGRDFHGSGGDLPSDLQWVVNGYLLPLSALLLLGGALGDRFGRRRLLVVGIALFALGSIACALAPTLPWLILARSGQGVGAALLMPSSLAILGGAFSGAARGRAIGIWAAAGAATSAFGPVLGGGLIDSVGWRAIFLVNIPLAAGAIWLALRFVDDGPRGSAKTPLDAAGAAIATLALTGLTWGLTAGSGPRGWTASALAATVAGACLLAAFVWVEKRRGGDALMPLALFGSRTFIGLSLLTLLLYGALGVLLVLLPYVLIRAAGYSATLAGAALLPLPLVLALTSPMFGSLAGRVGPRLPLSIGPAVAAVGFLLTLRIDAASSYWTTILPAMLVISLGMAGAVAPLTTAVLTSVDAHHTGSASGLNSALARTGSLIATALIGAVLAERGAMLIDGFHIATIVGAIAAASAGLCAFLTIPNTNVRAGSPTIR
jgi:EmrB/QacA subfamily drug resistance transporter